MKKSITYVLVAALLAVMAIVAFQPEAKADINAFKTLVQDKITVITVLIPSGSNTGTSTAKTRRDGVILGVYPTASDNVSFTNSIKTVKLNDNGTITVLLSNARATGSDNLTLAIPVLKR
ncbi:MAG: hypothetical protein HQL01_12925 [Nitrospirae bacterium]|nr:hypothetical protein [Nitrospirota bacterium]